MIQARDSFSKDGITLHTCVGLPHTSVVESFAVCLPVLPVGAILSDFAKEPLTELLRLLTMASVCRQGARDVAFAVSPEVLDELYVGAIQWRME